MNTAEQHFESAEYSLARIIVILLLLVALLFHFLFLLRLFCAMLVVGCLRCTRNRSRASGRFFVFAWRTHTKCQNGICQHG